MKFGYNEMDRVELKPAGQQVALDAQRFLRGYDEDGLDEIRADMTPVQQPVPEPEAHGYLTQADMLRYVGYSALSVAARIGMFTGQLVWPI